MRRIGKMLIIQKISRTILLLATLLLLMNSILPHHHHQEEVCFVTTHCSHNENHEHQSDAAHNDVNHDHHNKEADFCQIIDFFLTPDGKKLNAKIKLKNVNKDLYEYAIPSAEKVDLELNSLALQNNFIGNLYGLDAKCLNRALRAPPYA